MIGYACWTNELAGARDVAEVLDSAAAQARGRSCTAAVVLWSGEMLGTVCVFGTDPTSRFGVAKSGVMPPRAS
jgi:hypothetical protein